MKQNKKLIYVLLPVAIAIWGVIGYQIIQRLEDGEDTYESNRRVQLPLAVAMLEKDTFRLLLNYPDPFLKKSRKRSGSAIMDVPQQSSPTIPERKLITKEEVGIDKKAIINWPKITYNGVIENKQKKMRVAMIQISGQDFLMQEKETELGVKLLAILADSVQLSFQGQSQYFKQGNLFR